jgi:hypothetical protein
MEIGILNSSNDYHSLRLTINGNVYEQLIFSKKKGSDLTNFVQAYAEDYASGLEALGSEILSVD